MLNWQNLQELAQVCDQSKFKSSPGMQLMNQFSTTNPSARSTATMLNLDAAIESNVSAPTQQSRHIEPSKRWGHTSVEALNRMFIVGGYQGQYLGDIWMYDFRKLSYTQVGIDNEMSGSLGHHPQSQVYQLLQRSNHTSVFYKPHNSIYVFGGGHVQKRRFNDTLKIELPDISAATFDQSSIVNEFPLSDAFASYSSEEAKKKFPKIKEEQKWLVQVSQYVKEGDSVQMPSARTYHASCLVQKYMIVVGGESNNSDLDDFWALDLESKQWIKPEVQGQESFSPKRFLTASTLKGDKVLTFGGCHSEYVHLDDLNIFDMSRFQDEGIVTCVKVLLSTTFPTTRWGHAAAVMDDDKLLIIGGRNDSDVNDIHCFAFETQEWQQIEIGQNAPKPRRRHSCIFVSGCLVMFGGFDGEFYNDLHILNMHGDNKSFKGVKNIPVGPSTKERDYLSLLNNQESYDIVFRLTDGSQSIDVFANKALVLFRSIEIEVPISTRFPALQQSNTQIAHIIQQNNCPTILKQVYFLGNTQPLGINLSDLDTQKQQEFSLRNLSTLHAKVDAFKNLLQFIYTGKFHSKLTLIQGYQIVGMANYLQLVQISNQISVQLDYLKQRLNKIIQRDMQLNQYQGMGGEINQIPENQKLLNEAMHKESQLNLEKLSRTLKYDFSNERFEENGEFQHQRADQVNFIQSPEEEKYDQQIQGHQDLKICMNIDSFYDVVFNLDGQCYIRGNTCILRARSEYFRAMFDRNTKWKETQSKMYSQNFGQQFRLIEVKGIPKVFFNCIVQYLYSDKFFIGYQSVEFFLQLLIYADYFMLNRLMQICSNYIKHFVTCQNILSILLIAHAHNSPELEKLCIDFICLNEKKILKSKEWKQFKHLSQEDSLFKHFMEAIIEYKSDNFVQHAIEQKIRECSRITHPKIEPSFKGLQRPQTTQSLREGRNKGSQSQHWMLKRDDQVSPISGSSSSSSSLSESQPSEQINSGSDNSINDTLNASARGGVQDNLTRVDLDQLLLTSHHIFLQEHRPSEYYNERKSKNLLFAQGFYCDDKENKQPPLQLQEKDLLDIQKPPDSLKDGNKQNQNQSEGNQSLIRGPLNDITKLAADQEEHQPNQQKD